jgi:hypothetical protein
VDVLTSEGGSTLPNPRVVKVDPDRLLTSFSDSPAFKNKKAYLLPADVKKVSFGGTKYHELKSDNGTTTYSAPQWVDGNADGVAATGISAAGGDKNYPVAYTRNTKPQVGAELQIKDLPSGHTVMVKATSAQGLQIPETSVTPGSGGTLNLSLTTAQNNLTNSIQFHSADAGSAFKIDWEVKVGNGDWSAIGSTKHTVYIVMADPIKTAAAEKREGFFNISCRNAQGKGANAQAVVDAIYADFTDRDVQTVKPGTGEKSGTAMKYWGNPNGISGSSLVLISTGDGSCGAWNRLFTDILRTQGIDANVYMFVTPVPSLQQLQADLSVHLSGVTNATVLPVLYVKSWTLNADPFSPTDNDGIAAQGNLKPQSHFGDHSLVEYGGKYYDPSYGTATPHASHQAWEDAALDAFGALVKPDNSINIYFWIWKADPKGTTETQKVAVPYDTPVP